MKKLFSKFRKENKIPVQDPIAILIARLCDPLDPIYDAEFAEGMNQSVKTIVTNREKSND